MSQSYSHNHAWGIPKHLKGLHDPNSLLDPPTIPLNSVGEALHRALAEFIGAPLADAEHNDVLIEEPAFEVFRRVE